MYRFAMVSIVLHTPDCVLDTETTLRTSPCQQAVCISALFYELPGVLGQESSDQAAEHVPSISVPHC